MAISKPWVSGQMGNLWQCVNGTYSCILVNVWCVNIMSSTSFTVCCWCVSSILVWLLCSLNLSRVIFVSLHCRPKQMLCIGWLTVRIPCGFWTKRSSPKSYPCWPQATRIGCGLNWGELLAHPPPWCCVVWNGCNNWLVGACAMLSC